MEEESITRVSPGTKPPTDQRERKGKKSGHRGTRSLKVSGHWKSKPDTLVKEVITPSSTSGGTVDIDTWIVFVFLRKKQNTNA